MLCLLAVPLVVLYHVPAGPSVPPPQTSCLNLRENQTGCKHMSGTDTTAGTVVESQAWWWWWWGGSWVFLHGTEAQVHLTHSSVWQSKDVYPHQPGQNRGSSCSFRPHWDSALWHHPFLVFPVCTVKPQVKSALFNSAVPVQTYWDWNDNYMCNKLANYTKSPT